jgi:hypothetical protein
MIEIVIDKMKKAERGRRTDVTVNMKLRRIETVMNDMRDVQWSERRAEKV